MKYLSNTCLLLIFLFSVQKTLLNLYAHKFYNREYSMWDYTKQQLSKHLDVDLILLGDSSAKAMFKPKDYSFNSYNHALGGSTPIEGFYTLKRLIKSGQKPNHLIISYTLSHLEKTDTYYQRSIAYEYFNVFEHLQILYSAYQLSSESKSKDEITFMGSFIDYNLLLGSKISPILNSLSVNREEDNRILSQALKESHGHATFGTKGILDPERLSFRTKFTPSPLLKKYLVLLYNLAKKEKINIYWYSSPINQTSCSRSAPSVEQKFNRLISEVFQKCEILSHYNCLDNKYFGDPAHLYTGINTISGQIVRRIREAKNCRP